MVPGMATELSHHDRFNTLTPVKSSASALTD